MRLLRLALPALLLTACGGPVAVEIEPASLRFSGRNQNGLLHATPRAKGGRPLPDARCTWSSSDPGVATVTARGNDVTVSSAGAGAATVTCALGDLLASVPVSVRVVARVTLGQESAALELRDDRQPWPLKLQVFDDQGLAGDRAPRADPLRRRGGLPRRHPRPALGHRRRQGDRHRRGGGDEGHPPGDGQGPARRQQAQGR